MQCHLRNPAPPHKPGLLLREFRPRAQDKRGNPRPVQLQLLLLRDD